MHQVGKKDYHVSVCFVYTIFRENLLLLAQNHLFATVCCVLYIGCARDYNMGYKLAQLVEALRYKSEGRRFDSR